MGAGQRGSRKPLEDSMKEIRSGATWTFSLPITDSDGSAIATIAEAWFALYKVDKAATVSYTYTSDANFTFTDSTLQVVVPITSTKNIDSGLYIADFKVETVVGDYVFPARRLFRVLNLGPLADES
jgi:hypothetical protein